MQKQIRLNFIKSIEILSSRFEITWDKNHDGASFSFRNCELIIGTKNYKKDPLYTFSVLSHELMEIILVSMGGRYEHSRLDNNYLFNFSHQTFEDAIKIHASLIARFISKN